MHVIIKLTEHQQCRLLVDWYLNYYENVHEEFFTFYSLPISKDEII